MARGEKTRMWFRFLTPIIMKLIGIFSKEIREKAKEAKRNEPDDNGGD